MEWFDTLVEKARDRARIRVAAARAAHPGEHEVDLGRRLVRSAALRAGLAGAATGIGSLPGQIIRRLNPALIKAILRRLGLGWLPHAVKLWPLLGAPIAFALDRAALRTLGDAALATLDDAARERSKARTGRRRTLRVRRRAPA